jgi:hypothetical protein
LCQAVDGIFILIVLRPQKVLNVKKKHFKIRIKKKLFLVGLDGCKTGVKDCLQQSTN